MAKPVEATVMGAEVRERAIALLRARGDPAAADLLAVCALDLVEDDVGDIGLELVGPIVSQQGPLDLTLPMARTLAQALRDALPTGVWIERLWARPQDKLVLTPLVPPQPGTATPTTAGGDGGLNHAVGELAPRTWAGMRFRSESELRVAQALDRAGVLFLPNALVRLGAPGARHNREADFLVCVNGRWGVLEVDGAPFHPESDRMAAAERDQLFRQQGISVVAHVVATRCAAEPDAVVAEFLMALAYAGGDAPPTP